MPELLEKDNNHAESLLKVPEQCDGKQDNHCNGNLVTTEGIQDAHEEGDGPIQTGAAPPLPPEGGYGWVVLMASFLINGLVEGTCTSFGVFLPFLLEYFKVSRGKMALAGALLAGCFTMAGNMF